MAAWEYTHGKDGADSIHGVGNLGKVKKVVGPLPGGCVKDSSDRYRAPVVFGTVIVDSNNNFGVVDDRDVHPGYSIYYQIGMHLSRAVLWVRSFTDTVTRTVIKN